MTLHTPALCNILHNVRTMYCDFSVRPFFLSPFLSVSPSLGSLSLILDVLVVVFFLVQIFFLSPVMFFCCRKRTSNENGDDNSVCGKSKETRTKTHIHCNKYTSNNIVLLQIQAV